MIVGGRSLRREWRVEEERMEEVELFKCLSVWICWQMKLRQ